MDAAGIGKRFWFPLVVGILALTHLFFRGGEEEEWVEPYVEAESHLLIPQKNVILVVLPPGSVAGFLAADDLALLHQVVTRIEEFPAVKDVKSLLNAQIVRAEDDDIVVSGFLPKDFRVMDRGEQEQILRNLAPQASQFRELAPFIGNQTGSYGVYVEVGRGASGAGLLKRLDNLREAIKEEAGRDIYYTGKILLQARTEEYLVADLGKLIPLLLICISLIFLSLRKIRVLAYAWGAIFLSLAASLGVIRIFRIEITPLIIIIPVFGMGLLSDYLIHFFYHFLRRSADEDRRRVRRRLILPLSLTAVSSIIGFLSLCYLGGEGHLFLGIAMSLAILIVLGFVFFGSPWLSFTSRSAEPSAVLKLFSRMQIRVFKLMSRHKILFFLLVGVLFFLGLMQLGNTRLDTYPLGQLPVRSPIRKAEAILTGDFSGTIPFFLEIDTGRAEGILSREGILLLESLQGRLEDSPRIGYSHSLLTVIKTMNYFFYGAEPEAFRVPETGGDEAFQAMMEQYLLYYSGTVDPVEYESLVDSSYRYFSIKGIIKYQDWKTLTEFTKIVSMMRTELPAAWDLKVHGAVRLLQDESDRLRDNWLFSYLIGTSLIAAVILLIYRDLKLALLSILPAMVSMVLAVGIINALRIPIDVYSIIFVAIITGLVVDYSIHTLVGLSFYRLREAEPEGGRVFRFVTDYSGIPILLSFLTSVAAFSALLLSSFRGAVILGFLLLISLMVAFLLSVYLLPLLVLTYDRQFVTRRRPE